MPPEIKGSTPSPRKKLSELEIGESGEITRIGAVGALKKRLLEMGVVPGVKVTVERVAPLGDPMEVKLMGYHLSLRLAEAEEIEVKPERRS